MTGLGLAAASPPSWRAMLPVVSWWPERCAASARSGSGSLSCEVSAMPEGSWRRRRPGRSGREHSRGALALVRQHSRRRNERDQGVRPTDGRAVRLRRPHIQRSRRLARSGASVIKAFNHIPFTRMLSPVPDGEQHALLVSGDNIAAKAGLRSVLEANNFAVIDQEVAHLIWWRHCSRLDTASNATGNIYVYGSDQARDAERQVAATLPSSLGALDGSLTAGPLNDTLVRVAYRNFQKVMCIEVGASADHQKC
jgi:hypothetical protein